MKELIVWERDDDGDWTCVKVIPISANTNIHVYVEPDGTYTIE